MARKCGPQEHLQVFPEPRALDMGESIIWAGTGTSGWCSSGNMGMQGDWDWETSKRLDTQHWGPVQQQAGPGGEPNPGAAEDERHEHIKSHRGRTEHQGKQGRSWGPRTQIATLYQGWNCTASRQCQLDEFPQRTDGCRVQEHPQNNNICL